MRAATLLPALLAPALLLVAAPASAAAQRSALLLPDRPASGPAAEARGGVLEVLAERGIRLLPTPEGPPCRDPRCARALAASTGAEVVLLVEVDAGEVSVRAAFLGGALRALRAEVGEGGPGPAAGLLVEELLAADLARPRGFLVVRTVPSGLPVSIDGRPAGRSPLRRMVAPGLHRVGTVAPAGTERAVEVEVWSRREASAVLDTTATPAEGEGAAPEGRAAPVTRSEPSPWNYVLAGGLALGGIGALISPLATLAQNGRCVTEILDVGCTEKVRFGARSAVLLAVGSALLVTGVLIDVTLPIRMDVVVTETGGEVRWRGRF
ncbi:MAG: PEGA domain-containing protein [Sandaracinaceae bacterium]